MRSRSSPPSRRGCHPRAFRGRFSGRQAASRCSSISWNDCDGCDRSTGWFSPAHLAAPPDLQWPELGLTLDEPSDYELLKRVIEHFGDAKPSFGCRDVVELLRSKPEWVALSKDVRRKGAT